MIDTFDSYLKLDFKVAAIFKSNMSKTVQDRTIVSYYWIQMKSRMRLIETMSFPVTLNDL